MLEIMDYIIKNHILIITKETVKTIWIYKTPHMRQIHIIKSTNIT